MELITRILCQIRIVIQIGCRYRIHIEMSINRCAVHNTAFPVPNIFIRRIHIETNQVRAATAFQVEFTTPFVNQILFNYSLELTGMSSVTQNIQIRNGISSRTESGFCANQIGLCQTEQRNIGIGKLNVVCSTAV